MDRIRKFLTKSSFEEKKSSLPQPNVCFVEETRQTFCMYEKPFVANYLALSADGENILSMYNIPMVFEYIGMREVEFEDGTRKMLYEYKNNEMNGSILTQTQNIKYLNIPDETNDMYLYDYSENSMDKFNETPMGQNVPYIGGFAEYPEDRKMPNH